MKVDVKKIIHADKKYVGQNGREYTSVNYYLEIPVNGKNVLVPFKPSFKKGYTFLDVVAETIKDKPLENPDEKEVN